jgi:hypothetical protein
MAQAGVSEPGGRHRKRGATLWGGIGVSSHLPVASISGNGDSARRSEHCGWPVSTLNTERKRSISTAGLPK